MGSGAPIVLTAPFPPPHRPWVLLRRGWACLPPPELSSTGLPTTAVLGRVTMRGVLAFAKKASEGRGQPPRVPVLRASHAPPAPPGGQARTWEEAEARRSFVLMSTWLAGEEGLIGLHSLGLAGLESVGGAESRPACWPAHAQGRVSPEPQGGPVAPPGQLISEWGPGPRAQRCGPTRDRNETSGAARSRPSVSSGQVPVPGA